VLVHDVRQGFGWGMAWLGVFWVLDGLAQSAVRYGIREDDALPGVGGVNAALWIFNRAGAFLPLTVAVLLVLFPTGRAMPGRWGTASRVILGLMALTTLLTLFTPFPGPGSGIRLPAGVDVDAGTLGMLHPFGQVLFPLALTTNIAGVLVSMGLVVVRYRRSAESDRGRMRWLLWAVLVMALIMAFVLLAGVETAGGAAILALAALPALAMTVGIVRPRVLPVEDLISATLVHGLLALGLVAVDLLALTGLTALLGDSLDQRQTVVVAMLLTAVAYAPARHRLSLLARRALFGARAQRYDVVAGLASRLESTEEGADQLAAVAEAVAEAFGVGYVSVEIDRDGAERVVATHGTPPDRTRALPINYRGEPVGRLVLPAGGVRGRLSRRDEQLLSDLVRQAATAARTARLATQLQQSRERIVLAREEERRRIRRDLHDGLGPALGGAVFGLESARLLVDADPGAARERIAATRDQLQEIVADIRRLVHDLRPPALDDRGLVAVLRQQAERIGAAGPRIVVSADSLEGLPAAVEVAAFRIAGEAMTNVVKHARADNCTVSLRRDDSALVVEVADDGAGMSPDAQAGVGLVSLRERAAELGGSTHISCPPGGGTLVRARLPLHGGTKEEA
jgi:signal transduction histidine kinase